MNEWERICACVICREWFSQLVAVGVSYCVRMVGHSDIFFALDILTAGFNALKMCCFQNNKNKMFWSDFYWRESFGLKKPGNSALKINSELVWRKRLHECLTVSFEVWVKLNVVYLQLPASLSEQKPGLLTWSNIFYVLVAINLFIVNVLTDCYSLEMF